MVSDNLHKIANAVDKHEKSWGHEEWIVNNELYCGKRLVFKKKGGQTSLHFHKDKHETMLCNKGKFSIVMVDTRDGSSRTFTLNLGDSLQIPQFTVHRIIAETDGAELFEFSTQHKDSDSYRVQK